MSTWVVLGCGFIGQRLVRTLLRDGESVLACARRKSLLASLEEAGAATHLLEATASRAFPHAMGGVQAPIVVYTLPMQPGLPAGEVVSHAAAAARKAGARRFVYLSSTAVYGEGGDGVAVDEDSPTVFSDPDARPYVATETAVDNARAAGLNTIVLRLSPVYGPGRGVRKRLLDGTYQLVDDGRHVFSRVHVDDLVGIIRAAVDRAPGGATYCVADSLPCSQREHVEWLCEHLGVPLPLSVPAIAPGQPRRRVRNREVLNAKLVQELGYAFLYPSFREGELALDRELAGEDPLAAAAARAADVDAAATSEAAPATTAPATTAPATTALATTAPGRADPSSTGPASAAAPSPTTIPIWRADALAADGGASHPGGPTARTHVYAPGETVQVPAGGRIVIYVLAGAVTVTAATDDSAAAGPGRPAPDRPSAEQLGTGDAAVVPAAGLSVRCAGAEPAQLLIVTA